MAGIKSLAKDTAIYGLSSIIGRFLNWLLVPLYTTVFPTGEYGIVTYLYSIVAITLIVLTYGMETGFFRFANHEEYGKRPLEVYSTTLTSVIATSCLFIALLVAGIRPLSSLLDCGGHPSYVWLLGVAVAVDAVTAIPFSYLRFSRRPVRFATVKLINIGLNIGLNLFFIVLCPWIWERDPGLIGWFYVADYGVGYIFLANFISSVITLLLLAPEMSGFRWRFDVGLWRRMLRYSYPLLILGIAGIMNQSLGNILLPALIKDQADAMSQLGIYGANYKIAVVMVMFIQAFRFAYEPFIFAQSKRRGEERHQAYRDAMKYFVIFGMFIFLVVMYYLDIIRYFISPRYFSGLRVVPVVMLAELFFGVFFNLSVWYKITDRTIWGTWLSLLGLVVTVVMNVALVPVMGYMGCAWAAFGCYGVMMVASYFAGKANYPIGYDVKRLAVYFLTGLALYGFAIIVTTGCSPLDMGVRTLLLAAYLVFVCRYEKISPKALTASLLRRNKLQSEDRSHD